MMEKLKGESKANLAKRTISNNICDFEKNNFETRRIFPIEKVKKGELLDRRPPAHRFHKRLKLSKTMQTTEEENF